MNSIVNFTKGLSIRNIHTTSPIFSSPFMKKQKKLDPEIAKVREERKRKKLEREIREIMKAGKREKHIIEKCIPEDLLKEIETRKRDPIVLSEMEIDERAIVYKNYCTSRNYLMIQDQNWIKESIKKQKNALDKLKQLSPELYNAAIQPSNNLLPLISIGPPLTAPIKDYFSPDGEYTDISIDWTALEMKRIAEEQKMGNKLKKK